LSGFADSLLEVADALPFGGSATATVGDTEPPSEDDCAETVKVNTIIVIKPMKKYRNFQYFNQLPP
jgi:hypothetical protein